jgi:hypothetical protein
MEGGDRRTTNALFSERTLTHLRLTVLWILIDIGRWSDSCEEHYIDLPPEK